MSLLRCCTVLLLAAAALVPAAMAQVGVSPQILEVRLDQSQQVQTLRLHNFESVAKDVVVSVANWTLDADGNVSVLPPTETSLDRWLIVSPLKFTVQPRSVQTVRVAVRPATALPPGEHRAMIYFDEVLPEPKPGDTGMRGRFRIGTALYAYQGEPERRGDIANVRVDGGALRADVTATGNAHVRVGGYFAVWRADAFPGLDGSPLAGRDAAPEATALPDGVVAVEALEPLPTLPGGTRHMLFDLPALPAGKYVLELRASLSGAAHTQAIPFTAAGPPGD